MEIVLAVYTVTDSFPAGEKYGLRSQMCRCSISIVSNIAEGTGRSTTKDFLNFIQMAIASGYELETQTIIAERLLFMSKEVSEQLQTEITELHKMLFAFKMHLSKSLTV